MNKKLVSMALLSSIISVTLSAGKTIDSLSEEEVGNSTSRLRAVYEGKKSNPDDIPLHEQQNQNHAVGLLAHQKTE